MRTAAITVLFSAIACFGGCAGDSGEPASAGKSSENASPQSNITAVFATPSEVDAHGTNGITVYLLQSGRLSAGALDDVDLDFAFRQMAEDDGPIEVALLVEFPAETSSRVLLSAVQQIRAIVSRTVPRTKKVWIEVIAREDFIRDSNE